MKGPLIKIWLFVLIFLPLTLKLGFWQLERSVEKEQLLAKMERRFSQAPSALLPENVMRVFKPYILTGHFSNKHYLLDNRIREGIVGYDVLTPFFVNRQEPAMVLVNRGWIPANKYRDQLPKVATPQGVLQLQGYFYESLGKVPVLKDVVDIERWPLRIQQISWLKIQKQLNHKLLFEKEFRLLEAEQSNVQTQKSAQSRVGYKIGWPRTTMLPSRHTAYAYQWFALAFVLLILAMNATIKIRRESQEV